MGIKTISHSNWIPIFGNSILLPLLSRHSSKLLLLLWFLFYFSVVFWLARHGTYWTLAFHSPGFRLKLINIFSVELWMDSISKWVNKRKKKNAVRKVGKHTHNLFDANAWIPNFRIDTFGKLLRTTTSWWVK